MAITYKERNFLGLAGEFRVMSELLLRGHNPAKSYLQDGYDLILDNGMKIEVKCAHKRKIRYIESYKGKRYEKTHGWGSKYTFNFRSQRKGYEGKLLNLFDYAICWCIDEDVFYIIPAKELDKSIDIRDASEKAKHKFKAYRNFWEQLGGI